MTGRELIVFILQNNLENETVLKDDFFIGFMNEEETAAKFKVGPSTVRAWYERGMLSGVKNGDSIFFLKDVSDPRETFKR